MKKFLLTSVFALAMTAGAAQAGGGVFVQFGPPAPQREVIVVRPSPRHVYVPGYYRWNRGRYVWVRGYWVRPPRYRNAWVPGYWNRQPRGGHIWVAGYWR